MTPAWLALLSAALLTSGCAALRVPDDQSRIRALLAADRAAAQRGDTMARIQLRDLDYRSLCPPARCWILIGGASHWS
jgi:hypothetical protein